MADPKQEAEEEERRELEKKALELAMLEISNQAMSDLLQISNSNNPSMALTIRPFNGDNYAAWSKSVRMGLGAKLKLGFIDGSCKNPIDNPALSQRWTRCDYMVRCWLMNSLAPEIAQCFTFSKSAKHLWDELCERFGEANGPLLYQLHRDLHTMSQPDNESIAVYFSRLKRNWDEITSVDGTPECTCGAMTKCNCNLAKKLAELQERNKLLQFLMGLNRAYDNPRNNVLSMEPLPSINRAYYILQQVEKHQQVVDGMNASIHEVDANSVSRTKGHDSKVESSLSRKDAKKIKSEKYCDHCKARGHSIDGCFKIHGFPDWYKQKFGSKFAAQSYTKEEQNNLLDNGYNPDTQNNGAKQKEKGKQLADQRKIEEVDQDMVNMVCREVLKALKDKTTSPSAFSGSGADAGSGDVAGSSVDVPDSVFADEVDDTSAILTADPKPHVPQSTSRKSTRETKPPSWLQDYACNIKQTNTRLSSIYPLYNENSFASLSSEYKSSLFNVLATNEPTTYEQASKDPNWINAMNDELSALDANETWIVTDLPQGKKAISSRWVYKIKFRSDGTIERHKARFVVRGFDQIKNKDYKHTFSPVAKLTTVRLLIALATKKGWPLHQIDINNAFLHGHLDEEVYIVPPKGSNVPEGKVCLLKKSLYGLKQASRQWNKEFSAFLIGLGFRQSKNDYSLFVYSVQNTYLAVLVYVDDVLITGNVGKEIEKVKQKMHKAFTIKDMGFLRYFLGIEVSRSEKGTSMSQKKYIQDILSDSGLTGAKPAFFPLPTNLKLSTDDGELLSRPETYRRLIGRMLYLNITRPDLSYSIQHLSQFISAPRKPHMDAAIHVLRYLKHTINASLFYSASTDQQLRGYTDADWGRCCFSRRSVSGHSIFLGDALVSWKTKKQKTTSKSSA